MHLEELYKLKSAALLHDPPHKPYLMIKRERHEEVAIDLAWRVFGDEIARLLSDERIRIADRIAASFDRWPLSIFMGEKYIHGAFPAKELVLKNIVSPNMEQKLESESILENYKRYIDRLHNALNHISDWGLKYHVFYILYELLWIASDLPLGPAETRVPTHTVFDHNYATAAMVNWVIYEKDKINGLLVGLNVAGVQEFIASSRKLRDAWASSYIVSALTWYAIIELVDKLGPDVVLTPSLRMNPFYLSWLETRISGYARETLKEARDLIYLTPKIREMYEKLDMPPYPVIPGRVTLVLPPWSFVKQILNIKTGTPEEYFKERFRKGWELLWRIAEGYSDITKEKDIEPEPLWKIIAKALKYYRENLSEYGFDKTPPVELRVVSIEINADSGKEDLWRIYDNKYEELSAKIGLMKYRRKRPEVEAKLYELTARAFDGENLGFPKRSKRGFDYCTSCGRVPAMLVIPRDDKEYKEFLKKEVLENKTDEEVEEEYAHIRIILSPGEKLCPWCFLKRILGIEPRILKALVIGHDEKYIEKFVEDLFIKIKMNIAEFRLRFPSTSDIASTRLKDMMIRMLENEPERGKNFLNDLQAYSSTRSRPKYKPSLLWVFEKDLVERIKRLKLGNDYESTLTTIIAIDPEELWFHSDSERRGYWDSLFSKYGLSKFVWRYYALVRADGDSIGDLLEGKLTAFLAGVLDENIYYKEYEGDKIEKAKNFLKNYIICSCKGDYKDFISKVIKCIDHDHKCKEEPDHECKDKLAQQLVNNLPGITLDEARKRIEKVANELKRVLDELRIPVTPAYHVTISSALMRAALLDIALIAEDGFVVYAGGDDLLAFVSVDKALDIVQKTRLSWGGLEISIGDNRIGGIRLSNGFLTLREALLPMLPSIGRSYSIYIAHYYYPLSLVLFESKELLDDAKDKYLFTHSGSDSKQILSGKDVLIITYNPRGGKVSTMLPLSWHRPITYFDPCNHSCNYTCCDQFSHEKLREIASLISNAKKLLEYVDERVGEQAIVSHSLLYDFVTKDINDLLITLTNKGTLNTIKSVIRYIVLQNIKSGQGDKEKKASEVFEKVFEPLLKIDTSEGLIGLGRFKVKRETCGKHYGKPKREGRQRMGEETPMITNLVDAVRLIRSGMR